MEGAGRGGIGRTRFDEQRSDVRVTVASAGRELGLVQRDINAEQHYQQHND
jgi:hypothetical protein